MEEWSNLYAIKIELGGTYRHTFKNVNLRELAMHNGCVIRGGICGRNGAIHRQLMCREDYDDDIFTAQSHRRWL